MGIKENDTTPPSSVDVFKEVRLLRVLKGKPETIYSSESQVGKHSQVAKLVGAPLYFMSAGKGTFVQVRILS